MRTHFALGAAAVLVSGVVGWLALSWARAEANPQPPLENRPTETPVPTSELPPAAALPAPPPPPPGPPAAPEPKPAPAAPETKTPAPVPQPPGPAPAPTPPTPTPEPMPVSPAPDARPAAVPPALIPSGAPEPPPPPTAPAAPSPAPPTPLPRPAPAASGPPALPPAPTPPAPTPLPTPAAPVLPAAAPTPAAPAGPSNRFSANYISTASEEHAERSLGRLEANSLRRQEPSVVLEWQGPPSARVGQPADYTVVVRNSCPIPVQQVLVRVRIPAGMRLVGTEPKAVCDNNVAVWELGTLAPKQATNLQLRLVAVGHGELLPQAWVTFTGSALMRVVVHEPQLHLTATAPEKLQVGDAVTFVLTVNNPGDGPAERVKVHALLSDGLEHAAGNHVDFEIGNLAANESRNVQLICAARASGEQKCAAWAEAEGGLKVIATARINVSTPRLDLQVLGPGVRYLDRKAVYTFKVSNPGDAPANNVVVGDVIPEGFRFVTATEGGRHDPATHAVSWFLGDIGPGQKREVKLEVLAVAPGEHRHHALAQAARGLKVEGEVLTRVECLSELALEVTPTEDPVEVGEETTYEVKVVNIGSKTETAVKLACTLPEQMEFTGADAPAAHRLEGRTVVFEPLPQLTPKTDVVYHVHVKALAAGDVRFKAQACSANLVEPLLETRPTRIYADTPAGEKK
jgi:uncharacterized repeat protein (TIGR01451 family)